MQALHLELPATSANLGPGFDALGLAMSFTLTLDAEARPAGNPFTIDATGRNPQQCGSLTRNLILDTYREVLTAARRPILPLALKLHNEIPLGMGCGSSAAALLAGVLLANHFGELGWTGYQAMEEACRREGHPDNVAACFLGGMTASAAVERDGVTKIQTASCGQDLNWKILLAIPTSSLSTKKARALLPDQYSRADAVANVQSTALLVAAFSLNRPDLLRTAMQDRIHQPYRAAACELLPLLLPLADRTDLGVLGVALSGAGPSILILHQGETAPIRAAIEEKLAGTSAEILEARIGKGAVVI